MNSRAPKFKVTVIISNYKNIFNNGYTDDWSTEIFVIDSVLKNNPWAYRIKDNREKHYRK